MKYFSVDPCVEAKPLRVSNAEASLAACEARTDSTKPCSAQPKAHCAHSAHGNRSSGIVGLGGSFQSYAVSMMN